MNNDIGFWSLLPPILAIGLAIRTRQVIFSLAVGIFFGYLILAKGNLFESFLDTIQAFVKVFESNGSTRTILMTLVMGAIISTIQYSGGVNGFIKWVQNRLENKANFQGKLQSYAALTGFLIFVESNISILTVGTIFRPIFDKYKIPREKLAYLADSSSAPSCILFPLNAWGAYIMSLIMIYEYADPFKVLVYAIPFNFYAIVTLVFVFWVALKGKDFGPMKSVRPQLSEVKETEEASQTTSPWNMIVPILTMILSMPLFLVHSGWDATATGSLADKVWHSIGNGSGSTAVLNACFLSFLVGSGLFLSQKLVDLKSLIHQSFKGMNDMLVMAVMMVFAFAIGNLCNEMGTGNYVARITSAWLLPELAPALIFIISSFIAFSTGTSWGTFAIMISIAMPLSQSIGSNVYLMVAAVLGGGVFGDHCSPISDTTLIASVASGCDHIDHVRTQLPYALLSGAIAIVLYLVVGFMV